MSRSKRLALVAASCAVLVGVYFAFVAIQVRKQESGKQLAGGDGSLESAGCSACSLLEPDYSDRVPVELNRGPEIGDGFQGDAHPLFHHPDTVRVTADWGFDRHQERDPAFLFFVPPEIQRLFLELETATPMHVYQEQEFSCFLPANIPDAVGQMWSIDPNRVMVFLKQFHNSPSMRLVAKGRRAGPDGAFAILRAVSPTHLDIHFRIHAEFDVLPKEWRTNRPLPEAWYSPSCFRGRLVINRETGKIEFFSLGVPTDHANNVHITYSAGAIHKGAHGWMRVNSMELTGGDRERADRLNWVDQIESAEAFERLTKVFYKFKNIDWVPFEKAQEIARVQRKPIFTVVVFGALDNQSC